MGEDATFPFLGSVDFFICLIENVKSSMKASCEALTKPDGRGTFLRSPAESPLTRKQLDDFFDLRDRIAHCIVGIRRFEISFEHALRFGTAHNVGHKGSCQTRLPNSRTFHAGAGPYRSRRSIRIPLGNSNSSPHSVELIPKRRLVAEIIEDIAAQAACRGNSPP